MFLLKRLNRIICVALSASTLAAHAASVTIDLSGLQLNSANTISILATAQKLPNAASYTVDFQGTCHGTGQLAAFVPAGTSVGQFLNLLSPGASADIERNYQNNNGFPLFMTNGVLTIGHDQPFSHRISTRTASKALTFLAAHFLLLPQKVKGSLIQPDST